MSYFQRTIKMESLFGDDPKWRYENVTFGEEAPDMVTAIEMVEQDIKVYVKNKKEQMKKKENQDDLPFENEPRPTGIKLVKPPFVPKTQEEVREIINKQLTN